MESCMAEHWAGGHLRVLDRSKKDYSVRTRHPIRRPIQRLVDRESARYRIAARRGAISSKSQSGAVKPTEDDPTIMTLETMEPNPVWTEGAYAETVDILAAHADDLVYKVWGGDWCKDCRSQLPDFGAALDAAGVPDANVEHYAVEKEDDGTKVGPQVEAYDIEFIPTVVVERDGEEIARFVEDESVPIAVYLAQEIRNENLE